MIPRETVDKIIDAAHVEDVVGEFVALKKRGPNLLGLCPFHGEKTPSFTVSTVKGIYKCFGCGKAGSSVNFIMDHLNLTYPEALRWLAKKYNIDIVEREVTPEERELQTERESMLIAMQYAQRYFTDTMFGSDEGKSIGLGYFKERGLRDDIITKFQLGYSLEARNAFTQAAVKAGYQPKYLSKTGMSILSNRYVEGAEILESDLFDRYAGRVMFPIHDDGGRVVAFGGRTLSNDKKTAKYINSPETDIYHKSKVLYGLWFAKKAIQEKDVCYLVEGYMDVIAMHQSGIANVVASSGTSLTVEQIKGIHRHTKNIVVLYDGDDAGQRASNRAIPLLLEEGMNVKLLMFPDNDDPDSYSRKVTNDEFHTYLEENTHDFLIFKAKKSKEKTKNDPIQRATLIKDLVDNIAMIPDNIIRSVYVKECANIMEMEEGILQQEVNKLRRKAGLKSTETYVAPNQESSAQPIGSEDIRSEKKESELVSFDHEEIELLRIMMQLGNVYIDMEGEDENSESHTIEIAAAEYIIFELYQDEMTFENPIHEAVLSAYISQLSEGKFPDVQYFVNSPNPIVSDFTIKHVVNAYELSSRWVNFGVLVPEEKYQLKKGIEHVLFSYKEKKINQLIHQKQEGLRNLSEGQESEALINEIIDLIALKSKVNKILGRVVVK